MAFVGFYLLLLVFFRFCWFLFAFIRFCWALMTFVGFAGFCWPLLIFVGFDVFYWIFCVLLAFVDFCRLCWPLSAFVGFCWFLSAFIVFCWLLSASICFLLAFVCFYEAPLGLLREVEQARGARIAVRCREFEKWGGRFTCPAGLSADRNAPHLLKKNKKTPKISVTNRVF